jgi:hypothetical protein
VANAKKGGEAADPTPTVSIGGLYVRLGLHYIFNVLRDFDHTGKDKGFTLKAKQKINYY